MKLKFSKNYIFRTCINLQTFLIMNIYIIIILIIIILYYYNYNDRKIFINTKINLIKILSEIVEFIKYSYVIIISIVTFIKNLEKKRSQVK